MAIAQNIRVRFEPLRSLAFGSISGAYMGVGTAVDHPVRAFLIENLTDQTILFSFNGIDDHFALPASGLFVLDIATNMSMERGFFLAQGERLYAKEESTPPTLGNVYFSVVYGSEN